MSEFVTTKEYTLSEVSSITTAGSTCLEYKAGKENLTADILGGVIAAVGLWVTMPIGAAVATLVAGLVYSTYAAIPTSRELMQKGIDEMEDCELTMYRNNFEKVRMDVGILRYYGEGTYADIIQAVQPLAYYKNGIWHDYV